MFPPGFSRVFQTLWGVFPGSPRVPRVPRVPAGPLGRSPFFNFSPGSLWVPKVKFWFRGAFWVKGGFTTQGEFFSLGEVFNLPFGFKGPRENCGPLNRVPQKKNSKRGGAKFFRVKNPRRGVWLLRAQKIFFVFPFFRGTQNFPGGGPPFSPHFGGNIPLFLVFFLITL